jgi:hypothetical protein
MRLTGGFKSSPRNKFWQLVVVRWTENSSPRVAAHRRIIFARLYTAQWPEKLDRRVALHRINLFARYSLSLQEELSPLKVVQCFRHSERRPARRLLTINLAVSLLQKYSIGLRSVARTLPRENLFAALFLFVLLNGGARERVHMDVTRPTCNTWSTTPRAGLLPQPPHCGMASVHCVSRVPAFFFLCLFGKRETGAESLQHCYFSHKDTEELCWFLKGDISEEQARAPSVVENWSLTYSVTWKAWSL